MNLLTKNFIKNTTSILTLIMLIGGFGSCSSDKDTGTTPNVEGTVLNFDISIAEPTGVKAGFAKSASVRSTETTATDGEKLVSMGHFDAFISSKYYPAVAEETSIGTNKQSSISGSQKVAAAVPMTAGFKYRLLLYDVTGTTLISNVEATSGVNPNIKVDAGKTYKWFAVSLNNSGPVPNINASGVILSSSIVNKDVLYDSGEIATQYGNNYTNIEFRHHTARIQIKLDTRGLFGSIGNSTNFNLVKNSNNVNAIQIGDLNIKTGTYANLVDVSTAVTGSNMTAVNEGPTGTVKIVDFYTVNTEALTVGNLKIKLNTLGVFLDNSTTRNFPTSTSPLNTTVFTPALGSTKLFEMKLAETGVRVNGIYWGRTNLIYNASLVDKYRFVPNNEDETGAPKVLTEYWNWMSATPTGLSSDNVDPCTRVYPLNTWRMPTQAEFNSILPGTLATAVSPFVGATISVNRTQDAGYPANTAYPTKSQNLYISFYGYRDVANAIIQYPTGIFASFGGGEGHYWTSTPFSAANAIQFFGKYTVVFFVPTENIRDTRNAAKNQGRSIRCVRAQIYNPING